MRHKLILLLLICCPLLVQAEADPLPTVEAGTKATAKETCIYYAFNNCVNTVCSSSSDRNCIPSCQQKAQEKCR